MTNSNGNSNWNISDTVLVTVTEKIVT